MAKFLVETYYNCTFKVSHYLDKINTNELKNLEKRDDGKFEIIDVKLDNRKTKNLEKNNISKPIFTPNGYIILKIDDIKFSEKKFDKKKELNNLIRIETNKQLNQYSNIFFNKVKKNTNINEL